MLKYIQMIGVLVGITLVSGLALGGLNHITKDKIARNILENKKVPAVLGIVQRYAGDLDEAAKKEIKDSLLSNYKEVDIGEEDPLLIFVGNKDGEPHTVAFERQGEGGYGGNIGVMAGFNIETGDIDGIGITTHSETPGVGTKVLEDSFLLQFAGMSKDSTFSLKKAGGDIDGASGATRSSTAVADGVNKAKELFDRHRDKILEAAKQ